MAKALDAGLTSLYICYWSLNDPLCQSQSLAYLRELTALGHRFALMTFEQQQYALSAPQFAVMKRELASQGIYWYPLNYHKRFGLLSKAFDCVCGVGKGLWIAA